VTKQWLVSLDTDQIKSFVFATGRLKEIRGASALLDRLNRIDTVALATQYGGQSVYTGGGSGMFTFDNPVRADNFCKTVQTRYREKTGAATISGVIIPYETDQPFSQATRQATRQLRLVKASGQLPVSLLTQSFWSRCQRCGLYPATHLERLPANQTMFLCDICQIKRQNANPGEELQPDDTAGPLARLQKAAADSGIVWPHHLQEADELNDLGACSHPSNYLGFIYADGNGIGQLIEHHLQSEDELKRFSNILETAMLQAVIQATQLYWRNHTTTLPFIPVLIGGDDIILITTADTALPIAHKICLAFQQEVNQKLAEASTSGQFSGKRLEVAMSAGVVIAKASHPIFALEELAGELLRSAKRLSHTFQEQNHGQVCTLDFRVITTPTANSWEKVREQEFRLPTPPDSTGRLLTATCRPYACLRVPGVSRPSWDDIVTAIQTLKRHGFPRNKLHAWQDMLWQDPPIASILALQQMRQRLSVEHKDVMAQIAQNLFLEKHAPLALADDLYLCEPFNRQEYLSPLPDITEAYEFISEDVQETAS